ncbi:MAG: PAS domain-containing protein [Synergistaceae bacterium]|nr:PAS domain-containing protein [Synergistaceae bacterium]
MRYGYEHGIHPKICPFVQMVHGMAAILGEDCEIFLHNVNCPERSIAACANEHITGMSLGSSMSVYGLQLLNSNVFSKSHDVHTYTARSNNGRLIKCGVISIRDSNLRIYQIEKAKRNKR